MWLGAWSTTCFDSFKYIFRSPYTRESRILLLSLSPVTLLRLLPSIPFLDKSLSSDTRLSP